MTYSNVCGVSLVSGRECRPLLKVSSGPRHSGGFIFLVFRATNPIALRTDIILTQRCATGDLSSPEKLSRSPERSIFLALCFQPPVKTR